MLGREERKEVAVERSGSGVPISALYGSSDWGRGRCVCVGGGGGGGERHSTSTIEAEAMYEVRCYHESRLMFSVCSIHKVSISLFYIQREISHIASESC